MPYVDSVIQPGETVRYMATIHWVIYLRGLGLLVVAFVVWLLTPEQGMTRTIGLGFAALLLALSVYYLVRAWLRRWTTEYAITNRRVIYKQGLIWRQTMEMNMDKVSSVDVNQSIFGRLLDYGTVEVHGAGTDIQPITEVGRPLEFRNHITSH
jgi:uncharacterized membrane protein YdbT with pleckstrin-like domain